MANKLMNIITGAVMLVTGALGLTPVKAQTDGPFQITSYCFVDTNKDGLKDLVVSTNEGVNRFEPAAIRVGLNTGSGYSPLQKFKLPAEAVVVESGDLDGDKKDDLLVAVRSPSRKASDRKLMVAYAKDNFSEFHDIDTGGFPIEDVSIGDIDYDKKNDIVCTLNPGADEFDEFRIHTPTTFGYLKGHNNGRFGEMQELNITNTDAHNIEVFDFDGDGDDDVMTNGTGGLIYNSEKKDFDASSCIDYIENKGNLIFGEDKNIMNISKEWFTDLQAEPNVCAEKPHLSFLWRQGYRSKLAGASERDVVCKMIPKVNNTFENVRKQYEKFNMPIVIKDEHKDIVFSNIYQNN